MSLLPKAAGATSSKDSRPSEDGMIQYFAGTLEAIRGLSNFVRNPEYLIDWSPRARLVAPGQVLELVGVRRTRKRIQVWTDAANPSGYPVWLSSGQLGNLGNDNIPGVPLAAGSTALELRHTGAIYATLSVSASGSAWLYYAEEFAA